MGLLLPFLSGNFSYQTVPKEPWKPSTNCPAGVARNDGLAAIRNVTVLDDDRRHYGRHLKWTE